MLQKVRGAVRLLALESRPGVNVHADGGRARRQGRLGGDAEAVRESCNSSERRRQNRGVRVDRRVGGVVPEESGIGILQFPQLLLDGFSQPVVDHGGRRRRRRKGDIGGGGHSGGERSPEHGWAGNSPAAAREVDQVAERHDFGRGR